MKISIDEDVIAKAKTLDDKQLNLGEFLVCLLIKLDCNIYEVIDTLIDRGVLMRDPKTPDNLLMFLKYSKLVDTILLQSDKSVPKQSSLDELAVTLQEIFPKGKKCNDFGEGKWPWRGNKRDIATRLGKFFKLYGKYDFDDVIEATKRYVERESVNPKNMKLLQYFILKGEEGSLLATELENMHEEDTHEVDLTSNML